MTNNYYLGLDLGTSSVGWAVTDTEYVLRKYKGNLMWGVMLFDEAQHADERRIKRTARRRINRRNQRIRLLQELLAPEIIKKDKLFFERLKESKLFPEDAESRTRNIFFDDEDYTDADYFGDYPTIHHLIAELMENDSPHDIRLVYLACAYILKHRGHFLIDIDSDNIEDVNNFDPLYEKFLAWFRSEAEAEVPFNCDCAEFGDVLKKKIGITAKEKEFKNLLFGGKAPIQDKDEDYPINVSKLFKLICGGKVKLSEIFKKEAYKDLEQDSVTVSSAEFDKTLEDMYAQLEDGDGELLKAVKAMYDWSLLNDILMGEKNISKAKAAVYNEHKQDLKELKELISAYLSQKEYNEIFKEAGDKDNYVCYVQNLRSLKKGIYPKKKCSQEDFNKFVGKYLAKITPDAEDKEKYDRIKQKSEDKTLCPKQVNSDNRVIPYQLYYAELKAILENAKKYLPILNVADKYGSIADKILSIMKFRIPYYVGPLVKFEGKNSHSWIEKKSEGKIYPWNFEEIVDLDKSEDAFIKRMTCQCTYIAGEDVLPKNSLLYTKFTVLNELNNLALDGNRISPEIKQKIYTELFAENRSKVTKKKIERFLIAEGDMIENQTLSGVDDIIKSSLKPYHDFKRLLTMNVLSEKDVEEIIERITATTDRKRLKKWLKDRYGNLSEEDISYISKLSYSDYGRLSRMFLEEITDVDPKTGEVSDRTIMSALWNTQQNLMELLSGKYGFSKVIEGLNNEYYGKNPISISRKLEDMYVPVAARRTIIRALDIAREIKHLMKEEPKKIFVEMPRGGGVKGKRTKSRKEAIKEYLELAREFTDSEEINSLEKRLEEFNDSNLRSDKFYLYFMQLGRCMYSGEPINLEQIGNDNIYNIDHIYPQSRTKDDSISNTVLVKSELNGAKGDQYPIAESIRHKMYGFWKNLREKNLISEEKFKRLTRSVPLTDEELARFINRQLVETSQSAKAAALILKEQFPNSDIVYVKAGLVSEFRQEYDMLKCREVNDLHHAKDAYLNIVMGNVYDVQFTKNPLNMIKNGNKYSMKLKTLLSRNISRDGNTAWVPDSTIAIVKKMMSKNSIRLVGYSYRTKGAFYRQNPEKAKSGLSRIKSDLDTEKYGGYNNSAVAYFSLIKCGGENVIIPVEILNQAKFESDDSFARQYSYEKLEPVLPGKIYAKISPDKIHFPLGKRILKVNSLIEIDGFRMNLCQKDSGGKYIIVSSAVSLVVDKKMYDYVKTLSGFAEKSENGNKFRVGRYDGITYEKNIELYDCIMQKCKSEPFSKWGKFKEHGEKLSVRRDNFLALDITEQALSLLKIVSILKTGRSASLDLSSIGESKKTCISKLGAVITASKEIKEIRLIDQSPTGLIEKRSPNLIEL